MLKTTPVAPGRRVRRRRSLSSFLCKFRVVWVSG
jgi:hypothetical protein